MHPALGTCRTRLSRSTTFTAPSNPTWLRLPVATLAVGVGLALAAAAAPLAAATFTVTTTGDSGAGSLRQAILDANAAAGNDDIAFAIPAGLCAANGVCTITVATPLPDITGGLVVDAVTQPQIGWAPANVCASATAPSYMRVLLTGAVDHLFNVDATEPVAIRGFALAGADYGITVASTTATTEIQCNHFGLDGPGTIDIILQTGVEVGFFDTAGGAVIGVDGDGDYDEAERNVFGAVTTGVSLNIGSAAYPSRIAGNWFGLGADGRARTGTIGFGVRARQSAAANLIGSDENGVSDELERNIFANASNGVDLDTWNGGNQVVGNWFGVDAHGCAAPIAGASIRVMSVVAETVRLNQLLASTAALRVSGPATLTGDSTHNCIVGNTAGLVHDGTALGLAANYNYWGAADGPSGIGAGSGDPIVVSGTGTVAYTHWLIIRPAACSVVFGDHFDSGNSGAWSSATP